MEMLFPANPNTIEAAYKKVMMNLLVELNLSSRSLPPIERKKSIYVKRSDVNSKQEYPYSLCRKMFIDKVQKLSADVCLNVHAVGRVEPNYVSLPVLAAVLCGMSCRFLAFSEH